jgi:MFS family permease
VLVLVAGLVALVNMPDRTIPIMIGVAVLFGAADALHKPAVFTMPRQLVTVGQLVRAAGLRQLIARGAMLAGPAAAGVVLAGFAVPGAIAGLLAVFAVAAIFLSLVRVRYPREPAARQSVVASTREVVGYLRTDSVARSLVLALVGLNFFVIPVVNAGVALRVHAEGWGPGVLGLLMAALGVGAVLGTAATLRIKPVYPMRFALILLITQGVALAMVGVLPMVGVGVALGLTGLTAGLSSPMLSATAQALVDQNYTGRVFSLTTLADDALVPFALVGYGLVVGMIGIGPTTLICGAGMALLMGGALLRRPLRTARIEDADQTARPDRPGEVGPPDVQRRVTGSDAENNGIGVKPEPEAVRPFNPSARRAGPPDSEPAPHRAAPYRSASAG